MADVGRFMDVTVGKGSDLAKAIEDGEPLLARRIYWECELEFQKHAQGTRWAKPIEVVQKRLQDILDQIEAKRKKREEAEKAKKKG
jgi:hypothetical protein